MFRLSRTEKSNLKLYFCLNNKFEYLERIYNQKIIHLSLQKKQDNRSSK